MRRFLIVNDDQFSVGVAAIAWDGSSQAGRAARAAMPLLAAAEEVVIVQNVSDLGDESKAAAGDAFATYLARHGVKRVRRLGVEGDNVAQSLLRGAHEARCSLLVAGAYGRPRLYELALGGLRARSSTPRIACIFYWRIDMSFKDILAVTVSLDTDKPALKAAALLSAQFEAHAAALVLGVHVGSDTLNRSRRSRKCWRIWSKARATRRLASTPGSANGSRAATSISKHARL